MLRGVPDRKARPPRRVLRLDFITPQWSPGPIGVPDPKVDVAAVNPWMLRMAGEVADGVHVHPIGEAGYLRRHVVPHVAEVRPRGTARRVDVDGSKPPMTIVGDRRRQSGMPSGNGAGADELYGSTPTTHSFRRSRIRRHHRPHPGEAEGRRLCRNGRADHRRPHRGVRHRVHLGRYLPRHCATGTTGRRRASCSTTRWPIRKKFSAMARWRRSSCGVNVRDMSGLTGLLSAGLHRLRRQCTATWEEAIIAAGGLLEHAGIAGPVTPGR